ncbi:MAG: DUF1987 domain-containing protein [Flavobacteriales bacterium]|nr:DUF1987 domain-containing protein [Flavobacteriales bacterium]
MESLVIPHTDDTPYVNLDIEKGFFVLENCSFPEDAVGFYAPILEALQSFLAVAPKKFTCEIKLKYFNTSSAKQLLQIFEVIRQISGHCDTSVTWFYDKGDKDMQQAAERYSRLSGVVIVTKEN